MSPVLQTLKQWFGFDRRERRASFILLLITIITFLLRYTVPVKNISVEVMSSESGLMAFSPLPGNEVTTDTLRPFNFDPNSATFDSLTLLGLSEKQARTLISYRNKGGRFWKPEDISKIYGIDDQTAAALLPFIIIKGDSAFPQKKKNLPDRPVIELNRTDSVALRKLPGIGDVLSVRIIKYRNLLGGYASVGQLKEVYGITGDIFKLIEGSLRADTSIITKININTASFRELIRFPYLDRYEAGGILKYREINGSVSGLTDLVENKLITEEKAVKVKPYFNFAK